MELNYMRKYRRETKRYRIRKDKIWKQMKVSCSVSLTDSEILTESEWSTRDRKKRGRPLSEMRLPKGIYMK